MSRDKAEKARNETNNRRVYLYVGPTLLRALDARAEKDRRERSEWIRLLLEREILGA